MTSVLLLVGAAVVAGAIAWLQHQHEVARRAELAAFAASQTWTFEPEDADGIVTWWSDPPFGIGHSRRVFNVMKGVVDGYPMLTFDYRYKVTTSTGKSRSTRTYHYGVSALRLPARFPVLEVVPENVLTRFGNALGLDDVELESEEFNRTYRVRGPARFAHDVLSPRTMELLLRGACHSWRIAGPDLLGWDSGRHTPVDVLGRVATLSGIVDGVPGFVWRDHGVEPDAAG